MTSKAKSAMNFKTTYTLFGVLILLLVVFGITQFAGLRSQTDKSVYVLPSMHERKGPVEAKDIERVEIDRHRPKEEKLVFYRGESGWQLKEPSVRVENYLVDRVIDQVIRARVEEKADVPESLSATGLDKPAETVTLTKKGGEKEYTLNLGNDSPGTESAVTYVTSSDRKKPTAVKRSELDMLTKPVNEFRSKNLLEVSSFNAQAVTLQPAGKDAVALEKGSDGRWRFTKPAFGEAEFEGQAPGTPPQTGGEKSMQGVRDLVDALAQIRVQDTGDFVAEDVSDADLAAKYGLEAAKPATLRVEVKRGAGGALGGEEKKEAVTEVLLIGKKVETKSEKKDADKYYARLESDRAVVEVPARLVEPVLKVAQAPEVLRNRDLIQADTGKVDAVDITNATATMHLRKPLSESWKLYVGSEARPADAHAVSELLAALSAKRLIRTFPDAAKTDAELGLDKPVATVALWVEGIQPEEKKDEKKPEEKKEDKKPEDKKEAKPADKKDEKPADKKPEEKKEAEPKLKSDKPTVRLVFGKKEGGDVYVRREVGEEKARVAVPTSVLDRVLEGPLAYLDRTLPSFPAESEPVKLTLVRGGETFEIDREKKDEKSTAPPAWKLAQPKHLAGRTADSLTVENILANLRSLQADKLVAEKPSDADLDRYGLKAPAYKATVTLKLKDGKTEDRVYLFGKETEDKGSRYAKLGERDLVFQVRASTVVPMQGELLDPTILTFELDKVRGLKLHGWNDPVRGPFTLDLERKSAASWTAKAPANFPVNEPAAEAFLNSLRGLRAVKFAAQKTGAKPEHKLDVKQGALEIELMLEGEKDPVKLTVGGPSAADKGYFATSSRLPGDVFIVPEDRFKKVLEGPIYFRKPEAPK
jgi:Domain of unknown function (DUF4340)